MEFLHPHINHPLANNHLRKTGFPAEVTSTLFKLKHNLYLCNERKSYCKLSQSNRCNYCTRTDYTEHFLLCENSEIKLICRKLIVLLRNINNDLSLEQIIHLDFCADQPVVFAVGWTLALVTDFYYKSINTGMMESEQLLAIIKKDLSFFMATFPNNPRYNTVTDFLTNLSQ